jgi:hypothetical protein
MRNGQLRAVAFKEGDVWVVQGIEYDVVAQTDDLFEVPAAFLKALISTILVNRKLGRADFDRLKPAPKKFERMFEEAQLELNPTGPIEIGEPVSRPEINLRGYQAHAA